MKKVKKKIELKLDRVDVKCGYFDNFNEYTYIFKSRENINITPETEIYLEIDEPETLTEFLSKSGIKEKKLVKWLNDNY